MPTILVADDNPQISSILCQYCKKEGFTPIPAFDGKEAMEIFQKGGIDLALLDVMMPYVDGFTLCKEIRRTSTLPIIMVTARGEDFDKIMGLDIGADDYIVKPFSPSEVMARIKSLLRRMSFSKEAGGNVLTFDNLRINMVDYTLTIDGENIPLTKKEIELIYTLCKNPGKVFSRDNLLNAIWGYDYFGDARTVDSHIKRLRAKLDSASHPMWDIKTIWGVGYKFEKTTL